MNFRPPMRITRISRFSIMCIFIVLIIVSSLTIPELQAYYSSEQEPWKEVAAYLDVKTQTNDIIMIEPFFAKNNFLYYFKNSRNNLVISIPTRDFSLADIENMRRNNRVWFVYPVLRKDSFDQDEEISFWLYHNDVFKERKRFMGIDLFNLAAVETNGLKAGIFRDSKDESKYLSWAETLATIGASISIFDESTDISNVNLPNFDIVVFVLFRRSLSNLERISIEESIQNGLSVIVSDVSPHFLAGETDNLTAISSWFGATNFIRAPKEAKWNVKFTENARNVMTDLSLDHEYEFYMDFNSSTPYGCDVNSESVVYAYRVNDGAAVIFSHKFEEGNSIFIGPLYGFVSTDSKTFKEFLQALINSVVK